MLPLSDFTLTFNKSKDYVRVSLFIHAFLLLALWYSDFSWFYRLGIVGLLAYPLYGIIRTRMPHPHFHKLTFHRTYWLLHENKNKPTSYEQLETRLDAGIFSLMVLSNKNCSRRMIVFHDQTSVDTLRMLRIIEKVTPRSEREESDSAS